MALKNGSTREIKTDRQYNKILKSKKNKKQEESSCNQFAVQNREEEKKKKIDGLFFETYDKIGCRCEDLSGR